LRDLARSESVGESFAMPTDATSFEELEKIVQQLARRENRWEVYRRVAEASQVSLAPDEIWLLAQLCLSPAQTDVGRLARDCATPPAKLGDIARRLTARGLVLPATSSVLMPSASGREVFNQMIRAREKRLETILQRWDCEQRPEVRALLEWLARTLMAELPAQPAARRRGR
jgi:DNA-binding MarR family transcriptional regulator